MNPENLDPSEWLDAYFAGELSEEEERILIEWLIANGQEYILGK